AESRNWKSRRPSSRRSNTASLTSPGKSIGMKRALCIWLPNWPLQRLAAAREELRSRAVVLYQRQAGGGARVVACAAPLATAPAEPWNRSARPLIRPGMPLAEALTLASLVDAPPPSAKSKSARRNPSRAALHLEIHDPRSDRLALEELAHDCRRFSPVVGL